MNNRIKDKIKEIEIYLFELDKIIPSTFKNYESDFKTKAACERYFEKIAEAVVDLAMLVIKESGFEIPEMDYESFEILKKEDIISFELVKKLRNIKGMRNIIAHQYGEIDDEIMYSSISNELKKDVKEFLKIIKNLE